MFAWFRSTGEILRDNVVSAAELFERSIHVSHCRPEDDYDLWHDNACDTWLRWVVDRVRLGNSHIGKYARR